jgi:transcriptional regulator with XRE-family HTH domain
MSQQDVAERTGLKVQNISRLETDHRAHVRSDTLRRLAEALDCSTDYLVGLTDELQPPKRRRKADKQGNLWPADAALVVAENGIGSRLACS